MKKLVTAILLLVSLTSLCAQTPEMVEIPAGSFYMGSHGYGYHEDETPLHKVNITKPFLMGVKEVTNAEYELFDPRHAELRGKYGFSKEDDEAVVYVSWYDAMAYCKWLSEKEGKTYRLPTEAEWEYAAKAGSYANYVTGKYMHRPTMDKKQNRIRFHQDQTFPVVELKSWVEAGPNAFGLYDINGNVEEWCLDWYGPYVSGEQNDPVGYEDGEFKVTRGGSHSTEPEYCLNVNRLAALPHDRQYVTGFRVVCAEYPTTSPLNAETSVEKGVSQKIAKWKTVSTPYFGDIIQFVRQDKATIRMYGHNHQPDICWCPNGDLLAVWFSTDDERTREMKVVASRLKKGSNEWSAPMEFFKVPDRNMTGTSLYYDVKSDALLHLNGVEATGWWRNLAVCMRKSYDNGATWTKAEIVLPEHTTGHQLIAGASRLKDGRLMQVCDATPAMSGGSVIYFSSDEGKTWECPCERNILGIHAGVVELNDGRLFAFGRGASVKDASGNDRMPISISEDGGKTWDYLPSPFCVLAGGQRLVLMRLQEGPLMLASFENDQESRNGMFVSLSYDEGATWTEKVFIYNGVDAFMDGGGWTGFFNLDSMHSEPKGYMAATQSPDGIIHLISSKNHYRFNMAWIESQLR